MQKTLKWLRFIMLQPKNGGQNLKVWIIMKVQLSMKKHSYILSTTEQVTGVLERYYVGQRNLLKLHIDSEKLFAELKYEQATNNEFFPHLFGKLNKSAILEVEILS